MKAPTKLIMTSGKMVGRVMWRMRARIAAPSRFAASYSSFRHRFQRREVDQAANAGGRPDAGDDDAGHDRVRVAQPVDRLGGVHVEAYARHQMHPEVQHRQNQAVDVPWRYPRTFPSTSASRPAPKSSGQEEQGAEEDLEPWHFGQQEREDDRRAERQAEVPQHEAERGDEVV